MRLYELSQEARKLEDAMLLGCDPDTGEILEDVAQLNARMAAIDMERGAKLLYCAALFKEYNAEANAVDKEIKNLQTRQKAASNHAERLREFVGEFLGDKEKLSDARCKISWRKNPASVELEEDWKTELPDEFIKIERTAMKKELLTVLKAPSLHPLIEGGEIEEIPGAHLSTPSKSVSIR